MSSYRAKVGGEVGMNGEDYKGGQFLPSSKDTVKGQNGTKSNGKPRKVEIAPYKYEMATEGQQSIWQKISGVCEFEKTGYSKETGATGSLKFAEYFNWKGAGWTAEAVDEVRELANRWNNGERWV